MRPERCCTGWNISLWTFNNCRLQSNYSAIIGRYRICQFIKPQIRLELHDKKFCCASWLFQRPNEVRGKRPPRSLNETCRSSSVWFWTKRAGVLQFDFQFAYSPLASIIVRWYHRIFKKIENVVSAFDQALFERNELLTKPVYILFEQIVQTPGPWRLVYNVARISIPFVNGLRNLSLHNFC